jgi:hypothetical protein
LDFDGRRQNGRIVLIKNNDVRCMQVSYLTALNKYREEGCPVVNEDKMYIHSSHTRPKNWSDCALGLLAPFSKGNRLIILHMGHHRGFYLKLSQKTGDCHNEMNSENCIHLLKEMR